MNTKAVVCVILLALVFTGNAHADDKESQGITVISYGIYERLLEDLATRLRLAAICRYCGKQALYDSLVNNLHAYIESELEKMPDTLQQSTPKMKENELTKYITNPDKRNLLSYIIWGNMNAYMGGYLDSLIGVGDTIDKEQYCDFMIKKADNEMAEPLPATK